MKLFLIVLSSTVCVQNFLSSKYELYLWSRQPFIKYHFFFKAISCFKWQKEELSQVLSQERNILKKRSSQITRMILSKRTHYVHFPSIFLFLGSTGVALHDSELNYLSYRYYQSIYHEHQPLEQYLWQKCDRFFRSLK